MMHILTGRKKFASARPRVPLGKWMCTMVELILFLSTPALIWLLGRLLNVGGDTQPSLIVDRLLDAETATRNVALFGVEANSTVRNILTRFALAGNLSIALPVGGEGDTLGWPSILRRRDIQVLDNPSERYSILAHKAIYNKTRIASIMSEDAAYIGIIMDPLQKFKSLFHHLEVAKCFNLTSNNTIGEFLHNPRPVCLNSSNSATGRYNLQNVLCSDFGLPASESINATYVDNLIKQIDEQFKLILVYEYLDESLVLLKRYMQWKQHDIFYLPGEQDPAFPMNSEPIRNNVILHREWSEADYRLYDYFNQTLWRNINEQGPAFLDEVKEFKSVKEDVIKECSSTWRAGEIKDLPINSEDCKLLQEAISPLSVRILKQKGVLKDS